MGDILRARLFIHSTRWLKARGPSAGTASSASYRADRSRSLLLLVLSPESPDKVFPQSKQSCVEQACDTSREFLPDPLRWPR